MRRRYAISDLCLDGTDEERVDRILAIARDVLSTPDVTADDELADHGGTSLSIIRIVAEASRALDLDIDPRELGGTVTVRNLARVARAPVRPPSSDQP
jgi:acyl carrier protein